MDESSDALKDVQMVDVKVDVTASHKVDVKVGLLGKLLATL